MIKYYADSEEKYLKSVVAYGVEGDSPFLAWDPEGTNPVYSGEALPLFRKGLLLIHAGDDTDFSEFFPVKMEMGLNGNIVLFGLDDSAYAVPANPIAGPETDGN